VLTEKSKYVTVYKKQADGRWKAVADIGNEDAPPAPAKK
jgi:ketosteroid isomerase-like protein